MASLPTDVTSEYDRLVMADDWESVQGLLAPLVQARDAEALYLWSMSSQPGESAELFGARHVSLVSEAAESATRQPGLPRTFSQRPIRAIRPLSMNMGLHYLSPGVRQMPTECELRHILGANSVIPWRAGTMRAPPWIGRRGSMCL